MTDQSTTPAVVVTEGGLTRNKQHYARAAMVGGGIAFAGSVIPPLSFLNAIFFFWLLAGGAAAVWFVQKKTNDVTVGEGAILGALAGLACGLFMWVLITLLVAVFGGVAIADAPSRRTDDLLVMFAAIIGTSCGFALLLYPILGAIGGLLGGLIFKPAVGGGAGAAGAAGPSELGPEDEAAKDAKRKRMMKIGIGCCGGCLGLTVALCGLSGYLVYHEEKSPRDTAGEEAIVSAPLTPGEEATLTIPATDSGTGRYGIWIVGDSELPRSLRLRGRIGCSDYDDTPYMRSASSFRSPEDDHPRWIYVTSEYAFGGREVTCRYQLSTSEPVPGARLVVTRLTRPSDWLD